MDGLPGPEPLPEALDVAPGPPPDALLLDAPDGVHVLGPPGADSDADGHADTVLLASPGGGLLLATDLDADAHVDVATTIGPDATATTVLRGPDGTLPVDPEPWEPGWDHPPPAPSLDPATGTWVRTP